MQPLTSELRKELLKAHPGMVEETIDELEGWLSVRASIDATYEPARAVAIDKRIAEMIAAIPRYRAIVFGAATLPKQKE